MNNNLKSMATLAKERLKRGLYTNAEKAKAKSEMNINSYFIKNLQTFKKLSGNAEFVTISNEIDEAFIKKVYGIISSSDNVFNPIGQLVDKSIYNSLSDIQKQFYVLTIVDKYNKIKQDYFKENSILIS